MILGRGCSILWLAVPYISRWKDSTTSRISILFRVLFPPLCFILFAFLFLFYRISSQNFNTCEVLDYSCYLSCIVFSYVVSDCSVDIFIRSSIFFYFRYFGLVFPCGRRLPDSISFLFVCTLSFISPSKFCSCLTNVYGIVCSGIPFILSWFEDHLASFHFDIYSYLCSN